MKEYVKLTEVSESCAEHSFCKIIDGVVKPIEMLGHQSRSGSSMEVTHTEQYPILMVRVTDFLMSGVPSNVSCDIVMGEKHPVVVVPDDTHCHTVNYDTLKYQITTQVKARELLKEFWKLRDTQEVPSLEKRIEWFGNVLGEGLRRATRPWLVEAPQFIQNQCITHGEFTGLIQKADRVYQLNSEDFEDNSLEKGYYSNEGLKLWVLYNFSDNLYYAIEKWDNNPMYRFYNKADTNAVLSSWVTPSAHESSEFVDSEKPIEIDVD